MATGQLQTALLETTQALAMTTGDAAVLEHVHAVGLPYR